MKERRNDKLMKNVYVKDAHGGDVILFFLNK